MCIEIGKEFREVGIGKLGALGNFALLFGLKHGRWNTVDLGHGTMTGCVGSRTHPILL